MLIEYCHKGGENKLLKIINDQYPEISFNKVNMLLRKKDIRVNGKKVGENVSVFGGDTIQLYINKLEEERRLPEIGIIYEDENIVIADKPQDIETDGENSLQTFLAEKYKGIRACHRLDRNTAGITVFSLNDAAHSEMLKAFTERRIDKYYVGLCCGYFEKKDAVLEAFLFKDAKKARVYISDKQDKGYVPIATEYEVVEEFNDLSLIRIKLITGKTHQIRAHLAHVGHPLLGDGKYGKNEFNRKYGTDIQQLYALKVGFKFADGKLKYLNGKEFEIKMYINDLMEYKISDEELEKFMSEMRQREIDAENRRLEEEEASRKKRQEKKEYFKNKDNREQGTGIRAQGAVKDYRENKDKRRDNRPQESRGSRDNRDAAGSAARPQENREGWENRERRHDFNNNNNRNNNNNQNRPNPNNNNQNRKFNNNNNANAVRTEGNTTPHNNQNNNSQNQSGNNQRRNKNKFRRFGNKNKPGENKPNENKPQ